MPVQPPSPAAKLESGERLELLLIGSLAFVLRAWALRDQIFSDDEWHALRSAVGHSYRDLLGDLGRAASPGLHLFFKILYDTVGLTELRMRLPMFAAGVAATVVFPWVVAPWVERPARRVFALLLAVSPLLVYFSRYARPYSISVFCAFVGAVAFLRWWHGGERRWATAYVGLATFGIQAHPAFAPTLLTPFAIAFAALYLGRDAARLRHDRLRPLLGLALATVAALAITVGPALVLDWGSLAERLGNARATFQTLGYAGQLALGSAQPVALASLAALALGGATVLLRRHPGPAIGLAGMVLGTLLPSLLSTADSISIPIVFLRYSLWLLPAALLLVAIGAGRLLSLLQQRFGDSAALAIAAAGSLVLFVAGPLPHTLAQPNAWTNHALFNYAWRETDPFSYAPNLRPRRLPAFYGQLATRPRESVTIVEAPWFYEWHNNPLPFYQRAHGQRVVAGMLGRLCRQPGAIVSLPPGAHHLTFRNAVDLAQPDSLRYWDVDYLVLHRNLAGEMPRDAVDVQRAPNNNLPESIVTGCLPRLVATYGTPIHQDPDLVVWDLRPLGAATAGP